jgi:P-type Ca2+ transporter type 2C
MNRPSPPPDGLTSAEATARLARDGFNELPSSRPRRPRIIAFEVMKEPMFLMLMAASGIYLVLGDRREALVLFASVFVVIGITFYQERRTERALEALRDLSSPRAQVLRDGEWSRIPGRDVVVGDMIRLTEGDRVPADAVVLACSNLSADESLLTGESVPVRKCASDASPSSVRPGGDDLPFVYSGSLITSGQGIARVRATALATELGRIGKALHGVTPEPSAIQRATRRAVFVFASIGLILCAIVTVLYGLLRHDWLNGLLAGITLAMANLPEEFPVVLTVFLALGAWRISRKGVLTRRAPAIETLGATTVLCVDKTGTLTENRMAIKELWTPQKALAGSRAHPGQFDSLIEYGVLASEPMPFDPIDKAFHHRAKEDLVRDEDRLPTRTRVHSYPLSPEQLSVSHVWQADDEAHIVAAKGAPEAIVKLCALEDAERAVIEREVARMAGEGLRVLAVAGGTLSRSQLRPSDN